MAKKLALVTGACGFIGSHVVELLLERGFRVRATDLESADRSHVDALDVEFIPSDLTKRETLERALEGVDYVFNTASLFNFSAPWDLLYRVNVEGARNLCEAALKADVKVIVHWSSGSIYGISEELPTKETSPIKPFNNYERSKWMQELVMLQYHERYGLPVTVIRPAATYGPRGKYGVMAPVLMLMSGRLRVIPRIKKAGSLVHVRDVAAAALLLAERKEAIGEPYNIADDSRYTNEELMLHVAELAGAKVYRPSLPVPLTKLLTMWLWWREMGERPRFKGGAIDYIFYDYWLDNSKIKTLGYKLAYPDTKVGLRETVKWYRDRRLL